MLEALPKIAAMALSASPDEADVVAACDIIAQALDVKDVYVIRAGDPHFIRLGSEAEPTEYRVKQRGYWLMWQALAREPSWPAGLADVEDRLVRDIRPMAAGSSGNYVVMILPGDESNSEMLIAERNGSTPIGAEEARFLEIIRPILCQLIGKVLDTDRQDRQKRQLSALADVARAFNNAHHMESVLNDLATAIAKASGFDWVTINVYDDALEKIIDRGGNAARYSNTETAALFRDGRKRDRIGIPDLLPVPHRFRKGRPVLTPDVFAPGATPSPEMRSYYERAHILSVAWLPLLFQDSLVGSVAFSSSIQRQFHEPEVTFLTDLAAQVATIVKGMRLYRDLEQSKDEILEYAEKLEETSQAEHFLARTDALTGIPNRRYLEEVLKAECARAARYGQSLSVIMADLDHFKNINDSYGHPVGDEALRLVSGVARGCSRDSDFLGRWGGDEFFFILPQTSGDEALAFASRFREQLSSRPFRPEGADHTTSMRISAGIAGTYPPQAVEPELLVSWADQALYQAKEGGRDQVRTWIAGARAA